MKTYSLPLRRFVAHNRNTKLRWYKGRANTKLRDSSLFPSAWHRSLRVCSLYNHPCGSLCFSFEFHELQRNSICYKSLILAFSYKHCQQGISFSLEYLYPLHLAVTSQSDYEKIAGNWLVRLTVYPTNLNYIQLICIGWGKWFMDDFCHFQLILFALMNLNSTFLINNQKWIDEQLTYKLGS